MTRIEVLFSPAEFGALKNRDLSGTTCVVFDVLRATSSIVTALANGAASVTPVATIEEAVRAKEEDPKVLLAGERDGFRITSKLTGSVDFDFGNSPREFAEAALGGKKIVMTTTNGTRALKASLGAKEIIVGSFLNLSEVADYLQARQVNDLLLICSGTNEEASYEDLLGAGALASGVWDYFKDGHVADSAQIARNTYESARGGLMAAMQFARNGRRLLEIPELRDDVAYCLQRDAFPLIATMDSNCTITQSKPYFRK
ncbi:MAG TPA: 2-phosphosulfolactate phosphatase [Candidatus Kapabacteria bacterium]|nr:2-phosphosulfolactate phosphatase [Candidatus Kapabacteria bacterium]